MAEIETKNYAVLESFELPSSIEGQGSRLVSQGEVIPLTDGQATDYAGKVELVAETETEEAKPVEPEAAQPAAPEAEAKPDAEAAPTAPASTEPAA